MSNVANASINTFGPSPKADFAKPSEEQIFVLTGSQLQEILTRAIQDATEHILQEIQDLKATVANQKETIATLEATAKHQEDNQFIQLQLISQLREATKKEPQPLQKDRGDILRALLAANGGKMLAKDARHKMHLQKNQFTRVIAAARDYIEIKPLHSDKRKMVLCLIGTRVP